MSIDDDFYDIRAVVEGEMKPSKSTEQAFDRIMTYVNTLEREHEQLSALRTNLRNVQALLKSSLN